MPGPVWKRGCGQLAARRSIQGVRQVPWADSAVARLIELFPETPLVTTRTVQRMLAVSAPAARTGAEALSFQDQLSYWDGRFATVPLEDRNLPLIAEQRILTPLPGAAEQITAAFQRTTVLPAATRDVLLSSGDAESFRRTYSFSPAFMETLVYVPSALQRERTALKLMRQILVERREDLRVGNLIPFGDLLDAITDGNDQPFIEKLKHQFEQARSLYQLALWRSAYAPVWNHHIDRLALLWDSAHGVAEETLAALRQGGGDCVRLPDPIPNELRAHLAEELTVSLRALRDATRAYEVGAGAPSCDTAELNGTLLAPRRSEVATTLRCVEPVIEAT